MNARTRDLVAWAAVCAPALHTGTDALEWVQGGFSPVQLVLNYIAFLPMPAVLIGLWAAQRPHIGMAGLTGALLYGFAFVYFAHTSLLALALAVPDYATLWERLGVTYALHGGLMIAGGLAFGAGAWRARVVPRWTAGLFLAGILGHLLVAALPLAEIVQTAATTLRNAGLAGMGAALLQRPQRARD